MVRYDHGHEVDETRNCEATKKAGGACRNKALVGKTTCAFHGEEATEHARRAMAAWAPRAASKGGVTITIATTRGAKTWEGVEVKVGEGHSASIRLLFTKGADEPGPWVNVELDLAEARKLVAAINNAARDALSERT